MQRIEQVPLEQLSGETRALFDGIEEKHGSIPNFYKTLANSSAALSGFLAFGQALEKGALSSELREQISLTVSALSDCRYCLETHGILGKSVGLTEEKMADARRASSPCRKTDAALRFTKSVVEKRGKLHREEIEQLRSLGFSDEAITDMIALIGWKLFANYFNHIALTEPDQPP